MATGDNQGGPSHANAPKSNETSANTASIGAMGDQASTDPSDIVYTPPESITGIASSLGSDNTSTTTLSNTNTLTNQSISGAASNISKREYIYFLPYPLPPGTEVPYSIHLPEKNPLNLPSHQFEPTNTLVLTSPLRTFADIRIYKAFTTSTAPTPNSIGQGPQQRLEWAFAGTSTSVPIQPPGASDGGTQKPQEDEEWENVTHSTWKHWLDSRYTVGDPSIPVDGGDMYPLSEELTLEVGHAYHPALEAVKTHEEMWRDEEIKSTSLPVTGTGGKKLCVVLRCHDDAAGVRGVIVRVGQYVQGILMQGDKTTVERWEWAVENEGEDEMAKWQRTVRIGGAFLPCAVCFRDAVLAVGGKVRYGEFEWV
ncbi:hypothetical protein COCMIDRAFT_63197, partial [Bipolaris oryzae ATCC 44560]